MPKLRSADITAEFLEVASDAELAMLLAQLWADVETRAVLGGSSDFVLERLQHHGRRGYLTAQERQGICRTLLTGAVPLVDRLRGLEQRRDTGDAERSPQQGHERAH
jgi:hypothetical protein